MVARLQLRAYPLPQGREMGDRVRKLDALRMPTGRVVGAISEVAGILNAACMTY